MLLMCAVCDRDALEHVWVSREEFEKAVMPACNIGKHGSKPFFIHRPAPIDGCDEDYMRSIST